jgi:ribosomal protein S27AE
MSILTSMDIDALHSTLLSISIVSEKIGRALKNLQTNRRAPAGVENLLGEADSDLQLAKATLARELGFRLCPRCWPPELIATDRNGRVNCPQCGDISCLEAA